jgi:hypothetical protein
LRGFIREVVGDTSRTLDGVREYYIDRYFKRDTSDLQWKRLNTWTAANQGNQATRTEENLKFVKLQFPVTEKLRWDGNRFFDQNQTIIVANQAMRIYPGWVSKVENLAAKVTVNGKEYTACKINVADGTSTIGVRYFTEYYVKNIGLVKREMTILDGDNTRPNDPWVDKAKAGFVHTLELISQK